MELDRAIALARRRLVPFLLLMYVIAFLDRANVGFAKQAFQADTGISEAAYALGAGLFFLTYAILEVPSNLIMHRVGARVWMCRIMVTWGLISAAMMFISSETWFYILRLLLGAAEAGFFPGVILYLTYWFSDRVRGQIMGLFYFGAPLAFIFGSPLSGLLLELNGTAGLRGWQWMFLVEGLLATIVGVWAYWYLESKPAEAGWLPPAGKRALMAAVEGEEEARGQHGPAALSAAFTNSRVLLFIAIYFLIQMSVYG
ncbi:MAG: MFS transporter, partial [Acetobacteraceae bacterium]|nr:MFS transporter [Acetobacteraceae bacterium]